MTDTASILQAISDSQPVTNTTPTTGRVDQPVVLEEIDETWDTRNDPPLPPVPTLTSVAPTSGASGAEFTLTGTGFVEGSVLAGTLSTGGANLTIVSETSITVNLSGVPGEYTVGVETDGGISELLPVTLT